MDLNKPVAHEEDRIFSWRVPKKTHKLAPLGKYSILFLKRRKMSHSASLSSIQRQMKNSFKNSQTNPIYPAHRQSL